MTSMEPVDITVTSGSLSPVEQATAAPGEVRSVKIPPMAPASHRNFCEKIIAALGSIHPCDREADHQGVCSFRGYTE